MIYLGSDPVGITTSIPKFADIAKIDCGTLIFTEDTLANGTRINHSLGVIPDFLYCCSITPFADDVTGWTRNYFSQSSVVSWPSNDAANYYAYTTFIITPSTATTQLAAKIKSDCADLTSISCASPGTSVSSYFKANVKYLYIVGKFKGVTPNA